MVQPLGTYVTSFNLIYGDGNPLVMESLCHVIIEYLLKLAGRFDLCVCIEGPDDRLDNCMGQWEPLGLLGSHSRIFSLI